MFDNFPQLKNTQKSKVSISQTLDCFFTTFTILVLVVVPPATMGVSSPLSMSWSRLVGAEGSGIEDLL